MLLKVLQKTDETVPLTYSFKTEGPWKGERAKETQPHVPHYCVM